MGDTKAGFVLTMNGHRLKYRCVAVELQGTLRWFVTLGHRDRVTGVRETFDFTIQRNDETMEGIYRVYRTEHKDGRDTRQHIGYSPSLPFALRICATEAQRLMRTEVVAQ